MRKFKRKNKEILDWIRFDSPEEKEVYLNIKNNTLHILTWIKELENIKMINPIPSSFLLYASFKAWEKLIRKRVYTHDFDIEIDWKPITLEIKSKFTESHPDYRLRRAIFLFLYHKKVNFAELIKIKKWVWKFIKYY